MVDSYNQFPCLSTAPLQPASYALDTPNPFRIQQIHMVCLGIRRSTLLYSLLLHSLLYLLLCLGMLYMLLSCFQRLAGLGDRGSTSLVICCFSWLSLVFILALFIMIFYLIVSIYLVVVILFNNNKDNKKYINKITVCTLQALTLSGAIVQMIYNIQIA